MKYLKKTEIKESSIAVVILLFILTIPSFFRMLRPGIYSTQDFPYFRMVEYGKCISSFSFPCRWAPDAGLGYGEPVFNYYSHIPFLTGSLISLSGVSMVSSLKFVFALSLFGSALLMYFLSLKIWKNKSSAVLSSILYLYAPYRAVDVWVRGALPESFSFLLIPLILLCLEKFLDDKKKTWLIFFSLSVSSLILTHNLSVVLYSPILIIWTLLRIFQRGDRNTFIYIVVASLVAISLSAFYLLPSIFESNLVNLRLTTLGYFDFRAHFVTIPQLFISRFWGYGGSTWGAEDGLSLSVGQAQWFIALVSSATAGYYLVRTKKEKSVEIMSLVLIFTGLFYLFLTHNKSAFLWEKMSSFMSYIQFPWRFLGPTIFSFSLASGYLFLRLKRNHLYILSVLVLLVVSLNFSFFKEDFWLDVNDQKMQEKQSWIEQSRASIGDYWPVFGPIPSDYVQIPDNITLLSKTSIEQKFSIVTPKEGDYSLPLTYFPGWGANINGNPVMVGPDENGFVNLHIPSGENTVELKFHNTKIRSIGNFISFITLLGLFLFLIYFKKYEKNTR